MKIQNKLFLVFFSFSILVVTALVSIMQWSFGRGMIEYVNAKDIQALKPVVSQLAEEYEKNKNWDTMTDRHDKFRRLINSNSQRETNRGARPPRHESPPPEFKNKPESAPRPLHRPPPNHDRAIDYALLDAADKVVVGHFDPKIDYSLTPIMVESRLVGQLAISKRDKLTQDYEINFVEQQQQYFWLIALLALGLVAIITLPLARHLVRPIKQLTSGMGLLTQGKYEQHIKSSRQDELGELNKHFNELALTLQENENTRKRWLANTSHELRTPVAILRGELDAMIDKVRPLTTENLISVSEEVKHLQRLIEDLNLLASADIGGMQYRKKRMQLTDLINSESNKYRDYLASAGIKLSVDVATENIVIHADETRLNQLFENIIHNCKKYSEASELNISINTEKIDHQTHLVMTFADNGVGVDDVHLPNLFEHLYRVDDSRNRKTGGSGLGLSICRQIVIGHQGAIYAKQTMPHGLSIIVTIPLE